MDQNWIKINKALSWANQSLRELFFELYQTQAKEKWQDIPEFGDKFVKGIGKEIFTKSQKIQQKLLLDGDTTKWDIAIFADIYKNLRPGKKHKKIHDNLDQVRKVRNQVAHNNSLKIDEKDYIEMKSQLINSIQELNLYQEEFEKIFEMDIQNLLGIKEGSKHYDDKKYEENLKMLVVFQKNNQLLEIINICNQVLSNPSISPFLQEQLYCTRAESYLSIYEKQQKFEQNTDYLINAICDANLVIRENASSLNGYRLLAISFELQNHLVKSLENYQKCLVLDPQNEKFRNKVADLNNQLSHEKSQHNFDPRHQPITFNEDQEQVKQQLNLQNSDIEKMKQLLIQNDPLYMDVLKGHEYRDGSSKVKQDYQMAFKYYSKLAQKQHPEGLFNLAMLMVEGNGTKKNFKNALSLIEEAANLPAWRKIEGQMIPNIGVAESQQTLGTWYLNGTYLPKNEILAKEWMEKAYQNGNEMAANDLGLIYMHGIGGKQDLKKAEQLLIEAHKRGDYNAASNLCCLYIGLGDQKKAEYYHNISKNSGHMKSRMEDKQIMLNIRNCEEESKKSIQIDPETAQIIEDYTSLKNLQVSAVKNIQVGGGYKYSPELLEKYAQKGSKTAIRLLWAVQYYFKAFDYLKNINKDQSNIPLFFENLSKAFCIEEYVCQFLQPQVTQIVKFIEQIVDRNERNQLDEQARICLGYFLLSNCRENIEFLNECIQLYPKTKQFYVVLSQSHAMIKEFKQGLKYIQIAIQMDPSDYVVYYNLPPILRNLGESKKAIKEYEKFLQMAPPDQRKVPECYYSIANCYFAENQKDIKNLIKYYELGKQAEKEQIPVFLPYQSPSKQYIELALSLIQKK